MTLAETPVAFTVEELERMFADRGGPSWWVSVLALNGQEVSERKRCRFRFKGESAENAHALEWEAEMRWGLVDAVAVWRSEFGGERLSAARFDAVKVTAGDEFCVPEGHLSMPAKELEG